MASLAVALGHLGADENFLLLEVFLFLFFFFDKESTICFFFFVCVFDPHTHTHTHSLSLSLSQSESLLASKSFFSLTYVFVFWFFLPSPGFASSNIYTGTYTERYLLWRASTRWTSRFTLFRCAAGQRTDRSHRWSVGQDGYQYCSTVGSFEIPQNSRRGPQQPRYCRQSRHGNDRYAQVVASIWTCSGRGVPSGWRGGEETHGFFFFSIFLFWMKGGGMESRGPRGKMISSFGVLSCCVQWVVSFFFIFVGLIFPRSSPSLSPPPQKKNSVTRQMRWCISPRPYPFACTASKICSGEK